MSTAGASEYDNGLEPTRTFEAQKNLTLAVKLYRAGDSQKAEVFFNKVLEIDPENADALHLLGMIAYDSGKTDKAVDLIRRAGSLDPAF